MLYLIVVGSAASNKSIINISNGILQKLNNIIIEQSEELDKKHQIEHNIWKKLSKKDPTLEEPKIPPYCVVSISPDTIYFEFADRIFKKVKVVSEINAKPEIL